VEQTDRSRFWDLFAEDWRVDPPQAPETSDLDWFAAEALRAPGAGGPLLVLGATPQFARLPWPAGAWPVAVDFSGGMLRKVWEPAASGRGAGAIRGDWLSLPFRAGSFRLAVGDGCFGVLAGLDQVSSMAGELRRVLRPDGRLLLRCFVRVPGAFTVDDLFSRLERGEVARIGWFRWQVAMALQDRGELSVDRHRVWEVWQDRVSDLDALVDRTGLPRDHVHRIRRWEGERTPLHFPTLEDVRRATGPWLRITGIQEPPGPWGAHFPRLTMEPVP
jgi:SAM-dependent methyltransferase